MNLKSSQMYDSVPDNRLAEFARIGDEEAYSTLLKRYFPLIAQQAAKYAATGTEREDLMQEGMIGLLSAIREFDPEQASFSTFAHLCVERMLVKVARQVNRQKQIPKDRMITIDSSDEHNIGNTLSSDDMSNPEAVFIAREDFAALSRKAASALSAMEFKVLGAYLTGSSYEDIARRLETSTKAVDNALQRIRRKLK